MLALNELWDKTQKLLQTQVSADVYARWISVITPKQLVDNHLSLVVSNDFYQIWLEENYLTLIQQAACQAGEQDVKVSIEVSTSIALPEQDHHPAPATVVEPRAASAKSSSGNAAPALLPRYTFDSFVVGQCNDYAHAIALAVAQSPGKAYNPFFIHGGAALGKTHLMQAIGHYVMARTKLKVRYIFCEALLNEFIDAIQNRNAKKFRDKYRNTDLLLVDDINFLSGKSGLQEEFFHTFNALYNENKQIVMTSDRPAGEIAGLEKRLVTRFDWGQAAELAPPDFETRMAILRAMQKKSNVPLNEKLLRFIAANISSNVRYLESALLRLTSFVSLYQQPDISCETAQELLKHIIEREKKEPVSIGTIQRGVAEYFDLRLADLGSKQRSAGIALPRQIAMYLCRSMTNASFPEIGAAFGKTHATVLHACRRIGEQIENDRQIRQLVEKLSRKLETGRQAGQV